ncbi:MAG TPA: ATP-binding cassette domain-containing protein [Kribbellaceae bacterium]
MTEIALRGLTKKYGDVIAVDDLSADVRGGRVTGFLGPNGAGKTTTLRMLLGLARPTSGTAMIDGAAYRDLTAPARRVGAVLDTSAFHPAHSGRNALRVLAAAAGLPMTRVTAVLDTVELGRAAARRVGGYSLGMRQRLALAAALLGEPEVLVLDEPTNGLDPHGVHWLRGFIRRYAADGGTVLVSSHLLAELTNTVDDVLIINRGRLVEHAPLAELTNATTSLESRFLELTRESSSS